MDRWLITIVLCAALATSWHAHAFFADKIETHALFLSNSVLLLLRNQECHDVFFYSLKRPFFRAVFTVGRVFPTSAFPWSEYRTLLRARVKGIERKCIFFFKQDRNRISKEPNRTRRLGSAMAAQSDAAGSECEAGEAIDDNRNELIINIKYIWSSDPSSHPTFILPPLLSMRSLTLPPINQSCVRTCLQTPLTTIYLPLLLPLQSPPHSTSSSCPLPPTTVHPTTLTPSPHPTTDALAVLPAETARSAKHKKWLASSIHLTKARLYPPHPPAGGAAWKSKPSSTWTAIFMIPTSGISLLRTLLSVSPGAVLGRFTGGAGEGAAVAVVVAALRPLLAWEDLIGSWTTIMPFFLMRKKRKRC